MSEPNSSPEPRVANMTFEAILKGVGAADNPELLEELKPVYNAAQPRVYYSPEEFKAFTEILRQKYYPDLSPEEGLFELGRKSFHGYLKGTIVGRVAFAAIHIMGPSRVVMMTRLWRDTGLGEAITEKLGEKRFRSTYRNFVIESPSIAGTAVESVIVAGAKNVRHQVEELPSSGPDQHNFNIVFEWD